MKIIALIPAYNEEKEIGRVISGTKKYVDEVIVVDDGSKDKTYDKSRKADLVLRHVVNLGKGFALKTGVMVALKRNADIVVMLDSDGQHNPDDIPKLVNALKDKDIVLGVRKENNKMPFVSKVGNKGLNFMFNFLYGLKFTDTQSGFRVLNKNAFQKIKWSSSGYSVETEMLTKIKKYDLKYVEIPISTVYLDNYKGTTIFDGLRIGLKMLLWRIREQ